MIVGLSNTAADVAVSLLGIAKKIYLSQRSGAFFVS